MADSPRERDSRSRSPIARSPMARSPIARSPTGRSPMARSPMARSPMDRSPLARSPMARSRSVSRSRSISRSRSPSRSRMREWSRSPSRSRSPPTRGRKDASENPGNTLYVTGLSTRVTERELENHFNREGKVVACRLVMEPRTRISRGFAFVTMDTLEDADRCIKHLNQSILEGRFITVEKSRRKRPRTPTPGHYLGLKNTRETGYRGDRGRYGGGGGGGGGYGRDDYSRRSPRRSPHRGSRDYSPRRSPPYRGSRDYSPRRSPPYAGSRSRRERSLSRSPYDSPGRSYGRRPGAYAR